VIAFTNGFNDTGSDKGVGDTSICSSGGEAVAPVGPQAWLSRPIVGRREGGRGCGPRRGRRVLARGVFPFKFPF